MIGQISLQNRIEQLIENRTFPRFSIFVGPKGSGKKTLAHQTAGDLKALIYDCDVKIDAIRSMITDCYKLWEKTCYVIADADNMSPAAKNALLKVTEEPPNNAYFIMTLEDENNTLETIRSRGTVFHMDRYTPSEIAEYYGDNYFNEDDACWGSKEAIIKELCETPGDVDILSKDVLLFYDYVQLVVDNIADVSLANAFKISSKLALKGDTEGYDLKLFWKAFMKIAFDRVDSYNTWSLLVNITSRYLGWLRISGVNKSMLFDNWILEVRAAWQN